MTVRISVAMATYNGARYVRAQLDSIAGQSVLPHEIVITDDSSSDATVQIAEIWARDAPCPVRVYRNESNLGFANNFMRAAGLCTGDWIAFSDQDDVWYPNKLERVIETIAATTTDDLVLVCHMADVVDENLVQTGQRLPEISRARVKRRGTQYGFWMVGGCVMVFDATLLKEVDSTKRPPDDWLPMQPGFSGHPWLPHDKWICMLANALGSTAYLPEALGAYRRHSATVTGSHAKLAGGVLLRKAAFTGASAYLSLSLTASKTAAALRGIASGFTAVERRRRLLDSAAGFEALSRIQGNRAALYGTAARVKRLRLLAHMIGHNAYFGDRFYALGAMSLAKDLVSAAIAKRRAP